MAGELIASAKAKRVVADKAYDSDALRTQIRKQGGRPVIPSRKNHRRRRYDRTLYRLRNVVERFVGRLKQFRRVATRYEKTAVNYLGFVHFACVLAALN